MKKIEIIGHRGARCYAPENTLPAYKYAVEAGSDAVDVDVVCTHDGVLIGYHDLIINPDILCDRDGKYLANSKKEFLDELNVESGNQLEQFLIKNITFAELKQSYLVKLNRMSPYASWFPEQKDVPNTTISSLQEIVDYVNELSNDKMNFQIEIKNDLEHPDYANKPEKLAKLMYDFIVRNNLIPRVKIQAFDWRILYALNQFDAKIKTAYLESYDLKNNWQRWFADSEIMTIAKELLYNQDEHRLPVNTCNDNLESSRYQDDFLLYLIKELGGYSYEPEDNELTHAKVELAHKLGLKVFVWTWPEHSGFVFNLSLVKQLINWQIDGITTDDPSQLRNVLV